MSILARIKDDVKDAMRARDSDRVQALRLLQNSLQNEAKAQGAEDLDEDAAIRVLTREKKQRVEAAEAFEAGGAPDRAAAEREQMAMIDAYLPEQLDAAELERLVTEAVAETGASSPKEMGQVMKALMPKVQGRADGKAVSEAVRRQLAGS